MKEDIGSDKFKLAMQKSCIDIIYTTLLKHKLKVDQVKETKHMYEIIVKRQKMDGVAKETLYLGKW